MIPFYKFLISMGNLLQSPLLLALRLYFGYQLAIIGFGKFADIGSFATYLDSLHVPMASIMAHLVAGTEMVGGFFLLVGFASRLAGLSVAITMFMAYVLAHREGLANIFVHPSRFIAEDPFLFLLTAFIVLAFGPGVFSIDALLKNRHLAE